MKESSKNWLRIAKYDLKTADINFKADQYIACIEKCHNSLEKLLKGLISENDESPKKVHDLLLLASQAHITNLQSDIQSIFDELNDMYMSTRYPDEFLEIEQEISKPKTQDLLSKTKETFKWLEQKIKEK